jgi:hypothetical protein
MPLTSAQLAHDVYDVLVNYVGADEKRRDDFVSDFVSNHEKPNADQQVIYSDLGCGGKLYTEVDVIRVGCYTEDYTTENAQKIKAANRKLAEIARKQNAQSLV